MKPPHNGDHDEREWQGLDTRRERRERDEAREALGYVKGRGGWRPRRPN